MLSTGFEPVKLMQCTLNTPPLTARERQHNFYNMLGVGFEPTRTNTGDLKSLPLDQLGHPSAVQSSYYSKIICCVMTCVLLYRRTSYGFIMKPLILSIFRFHTLHSNIYILFD